MLVQHGDYEDAAYWVESFVDRGNGEIPFVLQLYDAGYDVWLGNNRGTEYSWDHEWLSSKEDDSYWMWTWADMGLYDDVSNIKMIKEHTGEDKIFYVGYSQGTIQMLYGLAHLEEQFHAKHLHKAVLLAPCFVANVLDDEKTPDEVHQIMNESIMKYQDYGVYAINGPNWKRDYKTLCDNFPKEVCDHYWGYSNYTQGQAVQSEIYWWMNAAVDLFQEPATNEDWMQDKT